ncbi:unnamed protein product [Linum tenue]|uniref:HTH myb-type domain-containing protein n=2 Tax=Linum tenue TaxID=586396 RepID=A0AAV0K638_9ROSI|nr:unnamed protein product [Linum tenue]
MVTLSSRSEAKSIEPVADDNIVEINPLRISPPNARDSAVLNDVTSTNCFHRLHTDDDSDLGYEQLEAYPEVTSEASTEAATYVKVFMASGSDANQTNAGTFEAPLTTNIPNSHSFRATSEDSLPAAMRRMHITTPVEVPLTVNIPNSHSFHATSEDSLPAAMLRMNITTPVSVQKQPMPIVTVLEGMDGSGSQIGNNQGSQIVKNKSKRKRKPRSEGDDMHLKAAVQKFVEGNWGYIVKRESMMGDRTAAQLSQRWSIITRKKSNTNLKLVTKANGSLLSEVQRAALHAMNMALDPSPRNTFVNNSIGVGQAFGSATAVRRLSLRRSLVEPKQVPTQKHNLVGRGNKMSSCGSEAAGKAKVQLGGSHGEQVKKDDETDPGHKKPRLNGEMLISQNPCHLV